MEQKTMEELRKVQVEMLSEVHRICIENNLKYYLCGGTLLCAVRHNGFIPWDDDIDISMPRKDYQKFINLCQNGALKSEYMLQNTYSEPEYHLPFSKIRKHNTFFGEKGMENLNIHKGIFIDIFPLDYSNKNTGCIYNLRYKVIKNLMHIVSMRQMGATAVSKLETLLYIITRPMSVHMILRISDFLCSFAKKGNYRVNYASYIACEKETMPIEYYGDPVLLEFENHSFYAPKKYDFVLKKLFGNYMELPPEEERVNHNTGKILFNTDKEK